MHVFFQGTMPSFVSAHMFCASRKPWFKCARTGVDTRDFKIQYGEALVRQKCERLLPVTSLLNVPARFPAVARLSGAANMVS